jgi:molybdate transport system substrate-binding protein
MTNTLHLLSAGAALGLVKAIQPAFEARSSATLSARFGAVGAMKEALRAGDACDLMILTDIMVAELAASGELLGATRATLGRVRTGIAVRSGEAKPDVATAEALKTALLAATAIYFPDPVRATAGIHFADVMRQLGVHDELAPRFRTFPNGATAMREMAACAEPGLIGCTQVTEINYSPGVELVGALPQRFELVTAYTAAISAKATETALAQTLIAMLTGEESRALREAGGFEVGDKA